MPNTPVFGITYPCVGSSITLNDFVSHASTMEAAIASVDTISAQALTPPNIAVALSQSVTVAVATDCAVSVIYYGNPTSQATLGSAAITIATTGLYRADLAVGISGFTTVTSLRMAITVNAVLQYAFKFPSPSTGVFNEAMTQGLLSLVAGDVVRANCLWTGTGGPATASGNMMLALVSRAP